MQDRTPFANRPFDALAFHQGEAARLARRALVLSRHAADCERWGLCADAGSARALATVLRVDALAEESRAVAMAARLTGDERS